LASRCQDALRAISHRAAKYTFVPINLVRKVAAFIAYGRLFVKPVAPVALSTIRAVKGLAVFGTMVLVDFAPVW